MDKVITIIRKEWSEVFKNKIVFFSVLFLPVILALMPLGMLIAFNNIDGMQGDFNDPEIMAVAGEMCAGLDPMDCQHHVGLPGIDVGRHGLKRGPVAVNVGEYRQFHIR